VRYPDRYRLMFMQRTDFLQLHPPRVGDNDEQPPTGFEVLSAGVTRAVEEGHISPEDAQSYAFSLWASVHGLVSLVISNMIEPASVEELREFMLYRILKTAMRPSE
jgi:Tetracyclin repressor-like, C-terminal domain